MLRRSAKTSKRLQRAKQGNAQACTALFVPPRGYLKRLSARLPARLLPEIIQLPVVVRKVMLDDAIARQQRLFDCPGMRQLPEERLIELHRRNLHSQRLEVEREQMRIRHSFYESCPHAPTQGRICGIDSSKPNCQRNAAVDLYVQPLSRGHAWAVSSASKECTIGHCGKKLVKIPKKVSALAIQTCLEE